MPDLADRHAGDAGGRIRAVDDATPQVVALVVPAEVAHRRDVQHLATLLVNLLSRCKSFVTMVTLDCPDALIAERVLPHAISTAPMLRDALLEMAAAVGDDAVPIVARSAEAASTSFKIVIGPGERVVDGWRAHGSGWRGQATRHAIADGGDCDLPMGPYVAACLAAAAVCWAARGKDWNGDHLELSAWDLAAAGEPRAIRPADGPRALPATQLDVLLAGVGAVGTAFLLTVWGTPELVGRVCAVDDDVIDGTNRNRCVLFFARDVEMAKAPVAERLLGGGTLDIKGIKGLAEAHISGSSHVVSAVDMPESRNAVQQRYPRSLIQASTKDVRVELLRCAPSAGVACLRCFNPPRQLGRSDDEIRAELAAGSDELLERRATEAGGSADSLREWVSTGVCSEVVGQMLARFRTSPGETQFAVGFVSVLAGVLLAAQAIKDALVRAGAHAAGTVPLAGRVARARYPLLNLGSPVAGPAPYGRDAACPACAPGSAAMRVWLSRFEG